MALLPASIDLSSASFSFGIPGDRRLGGPPLARVTTSAERPQTVVRFTVSEELLRLVFEPSLVIHLPPPLSNLALNGMAYAFATGAITAGVLHTGSLGIHAGVDAATKSAKAWMRDLVTGTPVAITPYRPSSDPELPSTLKALLDNLQGGGPSSEPVPKTDISGISATVRLAFAEEVLQDSGGSGVRIPAGADISLTLELSGTLVEVEAAPRVRSIKIESSSIILRKDGVDQAQVKRFIFRSGGAITVEQVTALGEAGAVAGVESMLRLFGVLASGNPSPSPADLRAGAVEGLVKREIEAALGPALQALVAEHADAVPGYDLREVLGIS